MSSAIDRWVMAVAEDLGVAPNPADTRTILDVTKDVAHNVDRPAAPVTSYLIGIAVGRTHIDFFSFIFHANSAGVINAADL